MNIIKTKLNTHSRTSGVTDHYALHDAHTLGTARRIIGNLNRVERPNLDLRPAEEPRHDPAELMRLSLLTLANPTMFGR